MSKSTTKTTERADTITLETSERYEILRCERRRHVVDVLAGRTTPVDLEGLAAAVAARQAEGNSDEDVNVKDEATIKQVTVSLHHIDLPKLASYDLVDYDRDGFNFVRSRVPSDMPISERQ